MKTRIAAGLAALALTFLLSACGESAMSGGPAPADFAVGAADAPVTVVEYASITCPVCRTWHDTVWPQVKARYVDTGQVRFVFRELPTPPVEVAVAGFLVARCARGGDRYFDVLDALFDRQAEIAQAGRTPLLAVADEFGMDEDDFTACIRDEGQLAAINANIDRARADGAVSTPSFVFPDGTVLTGLQPLSAFEHRLGATE